MATLGRLGRFGAKFGHLAAFEASCACHKAAKICEESLDIVLPKVAPRATSSAKAWFSLASSVEFSSFLLDF